MHEDSYYNLTSMGQRNALSKPSRALNKVHTNGGYTCLKIKSNHLILKTVSGVALYLSVVRTKERLIGYKMTKVILVFFKKHR